MAPGRAWLALQRAEHPGRIANREHVGGQIAGRLERAPSTISRELARNGDRHRYRAQAAAAAFRRALRPKAAKVVTQPRLRAVVEAKLAVRWSPQQIAGWLPLATLPIR